MLAATTKRKRFRQIFLAHLGCVKARLAFAGICTLGVAAADLLKPWPLKIIIDHAILNKRLPHFLRFLPDSLDSDKVSLVVVCACAIVVIAMLGGLFSYSQIFITSSV